MHSEEVYAKRRVNGSAFTTNRSYNQFPGMSQEDEIDDEVIDL